MTRPKDQGPVADGGPSPRRLAAIGFAAVLVAALAIPFFAAAGGAATAASGGAGRPQTAAVGGSLRAWGDNSSGQLGDGTTTNSDTPVKVQLPPGTRITSMRAGCAHTVALTTTGHVLAWGANGDGQLGDGTTTNSPTPVTVKLPQGTTIKAIRAGCFHSLALTTTGRVLAWGFNGQGELGNGSTLSSDIPVMVKLPQGTTVQAISAGSGHNLALTTTGHILAWGFNGEGELGDGTTTNSDTPVKVMVPTRITVTRIAAGEGHSLAGTSTGKALAWGDNTDGALGDGTTTSRLTPVRVKLPVGTKIRTLSGGCAHSLALTATGQVLAWGDNSVGALGDGTTTNSAIPVRVKLPNGTEVTTVAAGCEHSLALTATGQLLAWGYNGQGELGDGTTTNSDLPVGVALQVGLVTIAVAAGPETDHSLAIVHKAKQ
jgi:alpha-tubulin suppressor-like RCC1 family protein